MFKRVFLATVFLTALMVTPVQPLNANEPVAHDIESWVPAAGDSVWVDVDKNMGYLMHADGSFVNFPVVTGQRRVVCYLVGCYNAATPKAKWFIKSTHIQPDRYTFGPTGEFLRLYRVNEKTGEEVYSHYGFHSHKDIEAMLNSDNQFRSYGCILVTQQVLVLLYDTYYKNGQRLAVNSY